MAFDEDDGLDEEKCTENPGPDIRRRCTDSCWAVVLVACVCSLCGMLMLLNSCSNTNMLHHGRDHYRQFCGIGDKKHLPYVYYPDLLKDSLTGTPYGICVERCPEERSLVFDYEGQGGVPRRRPSRPFWFVAQPSFALAGRCIAYESTDEFFNGTKLCASPPCQSTPTAQDAELQPRQVCGLRSDGTDKYWLLSIPDYFLEQGWRAEGLSEDEVQARITRATENARAREEGLLEACDYTVTRDVRVRVDPLKSNAVVNINIGRYTGFVYKYAYAVFTRWRTLLSLGVFGSLTMAFVFICVFTCCVRVVLLSLVVCFYVVLVAIDYVLLVQAGIVEGSVARGILDQVAESTDVQEVCDGWLCQVTADPHDAQVYQVAATGLTAIMLVSVCVAYALRHNFDLLVGLLHETSRTVREMPSLVIVPFGLVLSKVAAGLFFMYMLLCVATLDREQVGKVMLSVQPVSEDDLTKLQRALAWGIIAAYLWAYYFHVAVFISIIANAVSQWYFYRMDPERGGSTGWMSAGWYPGKPVLRATYRILRFHLGSLALGSLVMTLVTLPRIILEYVNRHAGEDENEVVKVAVRTTRCCLWCFQKCVQFITEYAYVYVAAIGRPFCRSAQSSFVLFAKYPVQVAMDKMASTVLGHLVCTTVPGAMLIASWFIFDEGEWGACAPMLVVLSYTTTRLTVGVYDVSLTTLFVCAMRDTEHYGGRYMPEGLRQACGLQKRDLRASLRGDAAPGIEMGSFD